MSRFLQRYHLGLELESSPPVVIREATGPHNKDFIVKIFCKVGFSEDDIKALLVELNFWLINPHPALTPISEIVQEDPFIYIVYESPLGGMLETILSASDNIFSESFVRGICINLLEGLSYLHNKGVVHGNCLPSGIFFRLPNTKPNWPLTAMLSTIKVNYIPNSNSFTDLKDLAYSLCAVIRRGTGVFSRQDFNPIILKTRAWEFLTPEFCDLINQLWNSDKNAKGADYFNEHVWMTTGKKVLTKKDIKSKTCLLDYKINTPKSAFVRRKWVRAYGRVEASALLLSGDENGMQGPGDVPQPFSMNLKNTLLIITVTRYSFTFAIASKKTKEPILWLRFKDQDDYDDFKILIHEFTDPAMAPSLTSTEVPPPSVVSSTPKAVAPKDGKQPAVVTEADNPLQSLRWDQNQKTVAAVETAARKYLHTLQSQGVSYRRSTQIRCGWAYGKGGSLAPYPSEARAKVHPGKKWDHRVDEFFKVIETGKPLNSPIVWGEEWFVIDASWFRHWKSFVSSNRRMVPPGPIDNLWMVSASTSCLIDGLVEDTDDKDGDYRVITPEVWKLFENLYGGGPPISFTGPPANDVTRWTVHFAGIRSAEEEEEAYVPDWVEEFSDHESDVDSEEGALYIDLLPGQKASLDELMKIAELFGFDDLAEDDENDDIRLLNVEEGLGELFDLIDDADQYVENLERKKKILLRRASTAKKAKGPRSVESPETREQLLQHLVFRDFDEEESDSEPSVDSWSEEIVALQKQAA